MDDRAERPRHRRLRRLLLAWYRADARPLPWRATRDPYQILVSELMLHQTQTTRVEPTWRAFCERFPTARELAAASPADVLGAWQGLGYNRRAVQLHRAAQAICERHGGVVPDDLDALRALPGVGEYTARALLAFAFDRDAAPVDTNVARVLARAVAGRPLSRRELQQVADTLLPPGDGHDWGQALIDLGARYCVAGRPRCDACPIAATCAWRGADPQDPAAGSGIRTRRQSPFAGSDRFHRGRLVDALRRGPVDTDDLPAAAQLPDAGRVTALTNALVDEGMAEWVGGRLCLPGGR